MQHFIFVNIIKFICMLSSLIIKLTKVYLIKVDELAWATLSNIIIQLLSESLLSAFVGCSFDRTARIVREVSEFKRANVITAKAQQFLIKLDGRKKKVYLCLLRQRLTTRNQLNVVAQTRSLLFYFWQGLTI